MTRSRSRGARREHVPVVVMCYANPIVARGFERFADMLLDRGVSGLIVPDMPLEEAPATLAACDERGIALVPLVAPTTPDERLALIGARARGFLYTVSVTGTTGERSASTAGFGAVIARARACTKVPVAVGFGIATPEQAAAAAAAGRRRRDRRHAARAGGRRRGGPAAAVGELVAAFAAALRAARVG